MPHQHKKSEGQECFNRFAANNEPPSSIESTLALTLALSPRERVNLCRAFRGSMIVDLIQRWENRV
jgi:hypothetical protein